MPKRHFKARPSVIGRRDMGKLLAGFGTLLTTPAIAQESLVGGRPLRLIVAFPPGSTTDTAARVYAERLGRIFPQAVVVDNRPGGNGFIGVAAMLAAPTDGSAVLVGSTSTLATNVALFRNMPYDPLKDLAPLTMMVGSPPVLIVASNSPHRSLGDLLVAARARPGALNYGSGAASYQLMAERMNQLARVRTMGVPYRGAPEAVTAVMSGQVDFSFVEVASAAGGLQGGTLRALALVADERIAMLPNLPTASEVGLPGLNTVTWVGAAASAKTPPEVLAQLAAILTRVADDQETRSFFVERGGLVLPSGPVAMRRFQEENIALWQSVAAAAGIEHQ
jgi:tripartite-type tricarboxylate transporter receptor subunit TctC